MNKFPITVHMMIKDEDRFIWYTLNSILSLADKIFITDTGSSDKTVKIIESFPKNKIKFEKIEVRDSEELSEIRNKQLKSTTSDWFWVVDGDEIYPNKLINEIKNLLDQSDNKFEGIVVLRNDLLGDIYHAQDDTAGYYDLFGKRGHFALRLINKRKVPGLHVKGKYPMEGYFDSNDKEIIYHDKSKFVFTKNKLYHAMYLNRSSRGSNLSNVLHRNKYKFEYGIKISSEELPETFTMAKPSCIPDVTLPRSFTYGLLAQVITPLKRVKRKLITSK